MRVQALAKGQVKYVFGLIVCDEKNMKVMSAKTRLWLVPSVAELNSVRDIPSPFQDVVALLQGLS